MPDLSSLLRDYADSLDVRTPDPAELTVALRHRRWRQRGAVAAFLAAGLIIGLPQLVRGPDIMDRSAAVPATEVNSPPSPAGLGSGVTAVRTDPDDQGVVVRDCNNCGQSELRVVETPTTVDVELVRHPPPEGVWCAAVAVLGRTLSARLVQPLGDRTLTSDGRRLVPFNGADLLTLPNDEHISAGGGGWVDEPVPGTYRTREWQQTLGPAETDNSCTTDSVSYTVTQSIDHRPANPSAAEFGWTVLQTATVQGATIWSRTYGGSSTIEFDHGAGSVQLELRSGCDDGAAGLAVLVTIAQSLR